MENSNLIEALDRFFEAADKVADHHRLTEENRADANVQEYCEAYNNLLAERNKLKE